MFIHRDVQLMRAKVRRGVQHSVRHHEAVIKLHHDMRRQVTNPVILALSETLHTGKKFVLRHKRVKPHGRGVIMRRTDSGIVERIDVVHLPL